MLELYDLRNTGNTLITIQQPVNRKRHHSLKMSSYIFQI